MSDNSSLWLEVCQAQPLETVRVGELVVRPLMATDLDELCSFMLDDPEMNWPRVPWSRDNVEYVLGLRLQHYLKYGFGIYAVELQDKLIGWSGAQVWNESEGLIEVICFLKRTEWHKGIGSKLLCWTIKSLFELTSAQEIFALTRPDKGAGSALAQRVGFVETGVSTHYGIDAIVWSVNRTQFASVK